MQVLQGMRYVVEFLGAEKVVVWRLGWGFQGVEAGGREGLDGVPGVEEVLGLVYVSGPSGVAG